jgi:ATP-dependent helicase/nuclease subunit B
MFEPTDGPRLYGLPPGCNFPADLAAEIIRRMQGAPPEAMARVTIYLNTGRMQRHVRDAFDGHGARFLPRLRLITDLGRDPLLGVPPAVSQLRRRLELAQLVDRLIASEPGFAPGTAVIDLADSLARLFDEMQSEDVPPDRLDTPYLAEDHAAHWERSLRFIRIVTQFWGAETAPDAAARQRMMVDALCADWADRPPQHPVIVAGSTGSRGVTARFMAAVARLPQGAVILPGFDFDMPENTWNSLCSGTFPAEDHPQFRFLRLTQELGVTPAAVRPFGPAKPPCPARNRLISLSLRPAPVTDQWLSEGSRLTDVAEATEGMALIEARSQRAEAVAIAICLRKAAENGKRAALITPDRLLTRRVAAVLDRWGIVPDDSAGRPLPLTAPGRFLRQVAAALAAAPAAEDLLSLLKHPLTATGAGQRGDHLRFSRELELQVRRHGPAATTPAGIRAWAELCAEPRRMEWAGWLAGVIVPPVSAPDATLTVWTDAHLALAETLAAGPGGAASDSELWRAEAGEAARGIMGDLQREAEHGGHLTAAGYADLVQSMLNGASVRATEAAHPGIAIWGTLEARVQGADLVILAGLNEGVWPETPPPDPWLSRQMRQKAGLLLPERQIGLSAHDYQQGVGAVEVVLTRALRDAEAETVASRWIARLTNLLKGLPAQGGPAALAAMRARGQVWLDMAVALELPPKILIDALPPAPRPAPRPPVEARPRTMSVTSVTTLIRDPYAIYARDILKLRPLDPLRAEADARMRGTVLHDIIERFIRDTPDGELPGAARDRFLATAETVLQADVAWPTAQRIWLARLLRIADAFLTAEARRAARGVPAVLEEKGSVSLENPPFTLTAKPDRIDRLADGRVHIYDYKTGKPPTKSQMKSFEKQLPLEAAMAQLGAFPGIGKVDVEGANYIHLGGSGGEALNALEGDVVERTWQDFQRLIAHYDRRENGYPSRQAVFEERRTGDYDQLARFGEWAMSDGPEPEDVG